MKNKNFFFLIIINVCLIIISTFNIGCENIVQWEGVYPEEVKEDTTKTIREDSDIEFTPEGTIPIGSYIIFGKYQVMSEGFNPILWRVIENKSHYEGNVNPRVKHMTLLSEYIIDIMGYDAKETGNKLGYRAEYGNNRYRFSNIKQWLNTSDKGGDWWKPSYEIDSEPTSEGFLSVGQTGYSEKDGFLNAFNKKELELILDTDLECGINKNIDGGGTEIVQDKVFLLSLNEIGLGNKEKEYTESLSFVIFNTSDSRLAYLTKECYDNTVSKQKPRSFDKPWRYWLRSPYSWAEYDVWFIYESGQAEHRRAFIDSFGIRPAINIKYEGFIFSGNGTIDSPFVIN